jgi:anti-anti-sigma factor
MDELGTGPIEDLDPGPAPRELLRVDVLPGEDGTVTVRIGGELDIGNVDLLEKQVAPAMSRAPRRLIVDIGALRFADSSAIALWVRWAGRVEEFELREPSALVRKVVESMGLARKLRPTP